MKLSLDELEVESYALQVSESELSEVKGGTTWVCVDFGVAAASLILSGYAVYKEWRNSNTASSAPTSSDSLTPGSTPSMIFYGVDSVKYQGITYYGIDSVYVNGSY